MAASDLQRGATMGRIVAISAAAILLCSGCSAQEEPKAADVKAEMLQHVQPAAETFWNAVQFISDGNGSREIVPQTAAEWQEVIEGARALKKYGATLQGPEYAAGRGADWKDYAKGLVDVAGQAEAAAQSHDPDKVLEVGGTLYNVCSACHEVYMPNPVSVAPGVPTDEKTGTQP
jgi:hypothetical protein